MYFFLAIGTDRLQIGKKIIILGVLYIAYQSLNFALIFDRFTMGCLLCRQGARTTALKNQYVLQLESSNFDTLLKLYKRYHLEHRLLLDLPPENICYTLFYIVICTLLLFHVFLNFKKKQTIIYSFFERSTACLPIAATINELLTTITAPITQYSAYLKSENQFASATSRQFVTLFDGFVILKSTKVQRNIVSS